MLVDTSSSTTLFRSAPFRSECLASLLCSRVCTGSWCLQPAVSLGLTVFTLYTAGFLSSLGLWGMAEHLWHLDQTKVQHCYERYYTWFLMAQGNQAYFIGACEVLTSIPVGWFMANYKEDFALLWNVAYGTMCACMSDWIFQRRAETLHGITSAMAAITLNGFMSLVLFWRTNDPEERFNIIISNSCDVFVGWTLFSFSLTASMVRIRSSSTSSRE